MSVAEKILRAKDDYDAVYESGKKAEYDAFWDVYQQNGTRKDYQGAFYGVGWNDTNFKPKYDLKPDNCGSMFLSSHLTDLSALLEERGIKLDTSQCYRMDSMFYYSSKLTKVPTLDCRLVTQSACFKSTFQVTPKLETIEKIILRDDGSQTFSNAFAMSAGRTNALKNITFEGVIGQNIDFQYSPLLSGDSIVNIIGCLSDTASGKTLTLSKTAVENASFGEDIPLYPYSWQLPPADGISLTNNGDGSFTINGKSDDMIIGFVLATVSVEEGNEYEMSLSVSDGSDVFFYNDYVSVDPNGSATFTAAADGTSALLFETITGVEYNNVIVRPSFKKLVTWDNLVATKPNWTISLV